LGVEVSKEVTRRGNFRERKSRAFTARSQEAGRFRLGTGYMTEAIEKSAEKMQLWDEWEMAVFSGRNAEEVDESEQKRPAVWAGRNAFSWSDGKAVAMPGCSGSERLFTPIN
jgi:hypothetical protein